MELLLFILIAAGGFGLATRHVAREKGRPGAEGWWFGCLVGPLGLLIEVLLPTLEIPVKVPPKPLSTDGPHFRMAGEPHKLGAAPRKTSSVLNLR